MKRGVKRPETSWAYLGAASRAICLVQLPKHYGSNCYDSCGSAASYVITDNGRRWPACCAHFQEWREEKDEKAR